MTRPSLRRLAPPRPDPDERTGRHWTSLSPKLLKLVPVAALLAVALAVGMLSMPGCPLTKDPTEDPDQPAARIGSIPDIRVLVQNTRKVTLSTTGGHRFIVDAQQVSESDEPLKARELSRSGEHWFLGRNVYVGTTLALEVVGESLTVLGDSRYRGRMVFHPHGRNEFHCVNHIDIESYLAGVLRRELFPQWDLKAYQAQAIAARTYALHERATFGTRNVYDVRDDQSSQVYGGADAETPRSRLAVTTTHGVVLATGTEGGEKIFSTHYSSCCGGVTNNVAVLYGKTVTEGPLVGGSVCRDCSASKRYRWPVLTVPKRTVHRSLARRYPAIAAMPAIKAIQPKDVVHGRAIRLEIVGSKGRRVTIRAEKIRLALLRDGKGKGLYCMNCPVGVSGSSVIFGPGRGYGHGVGMCQWGIQGMALRGLKPQQILAHYYPNSKLFQAYR